MLSLLKFGFFKVSSNRPQIIASNNIKISRKNEIRFACETEFIFPAFSLLYAVYMLEPKQFKNNLIMFKDKPQFEFCRLLAGSNFEVDAQKNQNDV